MERSSLVTQPSAPYLLAQLQHVCSARQTQLQPLQPPSLQPFPQDRQQAPPTPRPGPASCSTCAAPDKLNCSGSRPLFSPSRKTGSRRRLPRDPGPARSHRSMGCCQRRPKTPEDELTETPPGDSAPGTPPGVSGPGTPPGIPAESWWPVWAHHGGPNPSQKCSWDAHGALTPRSGRRVQRTHSADL